MRHDPLNQLPADPDTVRRAREHAKHAADDLRAMVLMITLRDDAKVYVTCEGVPSSGPVAMLASDIPRLLDALASLMRKQESFEQAETRQ